MLPVVVVPVVVVDPLPPEVPALPPPVVVPVPVAEALPVPPVVVPVPGAFEAARISTSAHVL